MVSFQVLSVLLFVICATLTASSPPKQVTADEIQHRLPTSIIPTKYTIDLTFLGAAFSPASNVFEGSIEIDFKLIGNASALIFHASAEYIQITSMVLTGMELTSGQYSIDPVTDTVTIPLGGYDLVLGDSYPLFIHYNGRISTTDNYGIYRSSYTTLNGEISYLLATQFAPTYARRAFPCFDEPSFKATFDVAITYYSYAPFGLGVLFNTAPSVINPLDEFTTKVSFVTTPSMSTYLFAFIISDFGSTEGTTANDGTKYAVWSRQDLASSRNYAAEVGLTILNTLNAYTGRNFNHNTRMSKLDLVALPDIAVGAMENWGLVTYRERNLLWNQDNTADTVQQSIATTIAHELAHQWFGNLITCDWWSETYLNEGFATYFEYFIIHELEAAWEIDNQFVVNVLQPVLVSDSLVHSQSLKSQVSTPQEIENKFGAISYKKGGSILRMLALIMGEEDYKLAIQEYVQTDKLQFATATSTDVWNVFQNHLNPQHSGFPTDTILADVMENWIERPGYPLLTVSLDGSTITITQERFLVSGEDKESKWYVPITYVESESEVKYQIALISNWLTPSTPEITITLEYENRWVLLNTFQTGYYRVNYVTNSWNNIAAALLQDDFDGIVDVNRAQIVDDLFNIAKAKKLTYSEVLKIIEFLNHDTSYFPWVSAFTGFQYMLLRVPSNSQLKTKIEEHLLTLMHALYKTIPITDPKEDHIYTLIQSLASSWACHLGEESCVTESRRLFDEFLQSGIKPHKNLRSVVYCNALRYSKLSGLEDYLWQLYNSTEESSEKLIVLKALGCSTDSERLSQLLEETLKPNSNIRPQDAASVFEAVYSGSEKGVDVALDFLIENFKVVLEKYSTLSARSTLIKGIAARLTSTEQVNKLKDFISVNVEFEGNLKEVSEEALEEAESNLNWYSTHKPDLDAYYGVSDDTPNPDNGINMAAKRLLVLGLVGVIVLFGF